MRRLVGLVTLLAVLAAGLTTPVSASHTQSGTSVPLKQWFWDFNNDGQADPDVTFWAVGGGWPANSLTRLGEAAWQWRNYTQFEPTLDTSYSNTTPSGGPLGCASGATPPCRRAWYRDDTGAPPGDPCDIPVSEAIGLVCPYSFQIHDTYVRLLKVDMFFSPSVLWSFETTYPSIPWQYLFKGVAVHEIGHWVLEDLDVLHGCTNSPWTAVYTMCGGRVTGDARDKTWHEMTLHSHDINSANIVY